MPVCWIYDETTWGKDDEPPAPGRPHRDRRKINASRRAARRNRRK